MPKFGKSLGRNTAEARAFIGSTDHICALGTLAERNKEVVYAKINPTQVESSMRPTLEAFCRDKKVAVLMFPARTTDYEESKQKAIEYMLNAAFVLAKISYPDESNEALREIIENQIGAPLRDESSPITPHIAALHPVTKIPTHIFTIFMGPCYESDHTRYAPYPMLVMTWATDVDEAAILSPQIVAKINQRIREVFGGSYHADVLFLPESPVLVGR